MLRAIVRRYLLIEASVVVKLGRDGVGGGADTGDERLLDFLVEDAPDSVEALRELVTGKHDKLDVAVVEALALILWYRVWLVDDCPDSELSEAVALFQRLGPDRAPRLLAPLFDVDPGELSDLDVQLQAATAASLDDERTMILAQHLRTIGRTLPPEVGTDVATALITAYQRDEDAVFLDPAEAHVRAALAGTAPDDEDWLDRAGLLGHVLAERGDDRSVREALSLLREPLATVDPDHPHLVRAATALFRATALHLAANWTGPLLAEAAPELRRLADLIPEDFEGRDELQTIALTDEVCRLVFLGDLDGARWIAGTLQLGPETPDADRVRLLRAVLSPGARRTPGLLRDLDNQQDIAFGIALFDWLHAIDPVYPTARSLDDVSVLVTWAEALFEYASEGEHVRRGVELLRRARTIGGRLAPGVRADLASALSTAFDHDPDGGLIDDAIAHARAAVADTWPGDEEWLRRVAILGQALITAGGARLDSELVREALELLRPAVARAAPDDPYRLNVAAVTAGAVSVYLSQNWGGMLPIDTAAELRRLLEMIPEDFAERDTLVAVALMAEANHLIGAGDLSSAVAMGPEFDVVIRRAAPGTPNHDRLRVTRASLAVLRYLARFEPAPARDLAEYRDTFRTATALDLAERAAHLEGLGAVLAAQAELTGDRDVLDGCVSLLTEALSLMPEGSVEHRTIAATLGSAYLVRFHDGGELAVLDEAIALLRQRPPGNPGSAWERSSTLSELGHALVERHLITGADADYDEAWRLLRASAGEADSVLTTRLYDAYAAGRLAGRAVRWADAAAILADAVAMASDLAWRGLSRTDQQENLASQLAWPDLLRRRGREMPGSGMVNEAAAAAVRAGDSARAVELLDEGRAILLHQALDIRGGTAEIDARLDALQHEIDAATDPLRRHAAAREWDRLVAEIRSRPGLARFLRSPELPALLPAPGQTAVLVNPADFGSDAFLVTAAGVRVVPLPALRTHELQGRVAAFRRALAERSRETIDDTLDWLWRTTAEPVLDALPDGTHVHWCSTATLSFLPLHAAARRPAEPGQSVLDRVVSSYALSLRTLRFTSQRPDPPPDRRSLLVVAMPETPGLPALPGARREVGTLTALPVRTQVLAGSDAVRDAVSGAVAEHAWAHFACHAGQDLRDPSAGRLYLHDGQLTVADLSRLRLDHARFAFLSACDTARGGLRLPDEALHLGGALQLAGYQHVIATLWPISDRIAATMTGHVYDQLRTPDGLAPSGAATALHHAVRAPRERYPQNPALWASYVHFGP